MATTHTYAEIDSAMAIVRDAEKAIKGLLQDKGYENASVSGSDGRFFVMPHRYSDRRETTSFFAATFGEAVERIDALPLAKWSPELIEATLYAGEAA